MTPGTKLGSYEILSPLGKGGMGEVWRARDSKLGREVAIKTLPEEFASDEERLARFEREAKLLASLNHPNIAAIYGLEEDSGTRFLVLELVEGDTLADRLKHGAIPVEDSLKLALQIAEALEAAHEKGVIHRDLKPANIKVTPDAKVKVLDFGLAKAFAGDGSDVNLSQSPTLSLAATQQGVILGTAAYMSPEQARGVTVDKRADIWAFGCVLYEMLTGHQVFKGELMSDVMASVLKSDPDYKGLPPTIHPKLRELLRRCLEKEPKQRWHDVGDVRVEIEQVSADPSGTLIQPVTEIGPSTRSRLPAILVTAILSVIVASVAAWNLKPAPPSLVTRFPLTLPESDTVDAQGGMALSPTGARIAYVATRDGVRQLFVRSRDQVRPARIEGTDGAMHPFFSPDGEWIGFFTGTELRRVSLRGGPTALITPALNRAGATWGPNDNIVFSSNDAPGLMQVSASGGEPRPLTTPQDRGERHYWPEFLPGGSAALFTISRGGPISDKQVAVLSLETGEYEVLVDGTDAEYASSGHLVFAREASLWAAPFDLDSLEVSGEPSPMVEDVQVNNGGGWAHYATGGDGSLVYLRSASADSRTLLWVDREGNEELIPAQPLTYRYPRISPDGGRVALDTENGLWIWDFSLQTLTLLEETGQYPVWTSDGEEIVYDGPSSFFRNASDTSSPAVPIASNLHGPAYFLSDGEDHLVFRSGIDISMISLDGSSEPVPLLEGAFRERNAELSPGGNWMAYQSDQSGRYEISVRPFPNVEDSRLSISNAGGFHPVWSRDGEELFYIEPGPPARLMSVAVELDAAFTPGSRQAIMDWPYYFEAQGAGRTYDVALDGERFIAVRLELAETGDNEGEPTGLNVVLNWFEELKERVPLP